MVNPRLVRFWVEVDKLRKNFVNDGFAIGMFVIDPENSIVEIDGEKTLKQLLFEVSPHISSKWRHEREKALVQPQRVQPEGTTCFLPHLPPGGISAMTEKIVKTYWTVVMRAVLPDRKNNMQYDTHR